MRRAWWSARGRQCSRLSTRLGLVVVDEEHDASFKQDSDPRYDARTVAAKRAAIEGAVAVYGSATPRAESWARLERLALPVRIGAPLPSVKLVDLRREAGYPLSAPLLAELSGVAERGGRAILLLNRRGISGALHCRSCGTTRRCPSCDIALTLHDDSRLHCHHCGYSAELPDTCPECGSVELARIGAGTQRLDAELARRVPGLERIRLDADTASRPGALRDALERFAAARSAALIGTQMVAKGHHFPGVEVAAVVDADAGSCVPGLPFRGTNVPARDAARRTQRPGRPGTGDRADVPAGRDAVRLRRPARRRRVPRPGAATAGGARATRRFHILLRSSFRALTPATSVVRSESSRAPSRPRPCSCSGRLRSFGFAGRHRARLLAKTDAPRALASRAAAVLARAAPAMRRDGLTAVVDVDPQSL